MSRKIIVIDTELEYDYDGVSDANIKTTEYDDVMDLLNDEEIQWRLESLGWIHPDNVKERRKIKLGKKFFIKDCEGDGYFNHTRSVNIDNMGDYEIEKLAEGGHLLQEVTPKSALSAGEYKRYLAVRKRYRAAQKKKREAAKRRKEKQKQKKLEKARKLLAEAGEE